MVAISELFSLLGSPKSKLLILHAGAECSGSVPLVLRSLNSEHVFAEALLRTESERPTPLGAALRRSRQRDLPVADDVVLGVLRRWFFSRAADRGFSLVGFPQNLCQALVFDEWLDARGESLNACLLPDASTSASPVATHYCNQGLLREVSFPSHPIAVSA